MSKIAIFYKSVLGSTRKYAHWLGEALEADVYKYSYSGLKGNVLSQYKTVIVMSGTYASRMPLVSFLEKNWDNLKGKKVVAVAVGMVDPKDKESQVAYELIPENIRSEIKYFKVPGKFFGARSWGKVEEKSLQEVVKWVQKS